MLARQLLVQLLRLLPRLSTQSPPRRRPQRHLFRVILSVLCGVHTERYESTDLWFRIRCRLALPRIPLRPRAHVLVPGVRGGWTSGEDGIQ
jgi:hypothetical protein